MANHQAHDMAATVRQQVRDKVKVSAFAKRPSIEVVIAGCDQKHIIDLLKQKYTDIFHTPACTDKQRKKVFALSVPIEFGDTAHYANAEMELRKELAHAMLGLDAQIKHFDLCGTKQRGKKRNRSATMAMRKVA